MTTPTPDAGSVTPTVDFIPPPSTGPTRDLAARVPVVAGTGPHLSGETSALLRVRLRAAALFFIVMSLFMMAWRFLAYHLIGRPNDLWLFNLALILVLGVALGVLSGRRPLPPRSLKLLEFAIFGLVAAQVAMQQYDAMVAALDQRDPVSVISAVKNAT